MGTNYNTKIVTSGLVLCLDAANSKSYPGSGTNWTDLSGVGLNGTLAGGTSFSTSNGGIINFDGVNGKVTFPNITIDTSNGIAVDIWFKTSSSSKYQDIFDMADSYGVWLVTNYSTDGPGKIGASFNTATGRMLVSYSADTWYHIVLTGSGTSNYVYVNGVQANTSAQTVQTSVNFNTARLGQVDGDRASEYLVGNIAACKFYNRILSAVEVSQNFNALRGRFGI